MTLAILTLGLCCVCLSLPRWLYNSTQFALKMFFEGRGNLRRFRNCHSTGPPAVASNRSDEPTRDNRARTMWRF
eukprot:4257597-Amphidinium_carterae.1